MFEGLKFWTSNISIYIAYLQMCPQSLKGPCLRRYTMLEEQLPHSPHTFVAGHYTTSYFNQSRGVLVFKAARHV